MLVGNYPFSAYCVHLAVSFSSVQVALKPSGEKKIEVPHFLFFLVLITKRAF